jgi:hypothetical protein
MGRKRIWDKRTYIRKDGRTTRRLYAPPKIFREDNNVFYVINNAIFKESKVLDITYGSVFFDL